MKLYEKEKGELVKNKDKDFDLFIDPFAKSLSALEKADKVREEVIKKCGNNPIFKGAKKALSDAKGANEKAELQDLLHVCLERDLAAVTKPVIEEVKRYQAKLELAKTTEKKLRQVVEQMLNEYLVTSGRISDLYKPYALE